MDYPSALWRLRRGFDSRTRTYTAEPCCVFTGSQHTENHVSQVKTGDVRAVPKPSEAYLSQRQLTDYRERLIGWMVNIGKDSDHGDGCAYDTANGRAYRLDAFGTIDRPAGVRYRVFALSLGLTHLPRTVVVACQRVVHVSYVETVPIGDGFGIFTALFDEGVQLADADSTPADVGLAHELACDPPRFALSHG